jgi:hypothetical protein
MPTNFLLSAYVSGKLITKRWVGWYEAKRAKKHLESVGARVVIQWLDLDCVLVDVTDASTNP